MASKTCTRLASQISNTMGAVIDLASGTVHIPDRDGRAPGGHRMQSISYIGADGGVVSNRLSCWRRQEHGEFGPGTCSVIEITREGGERYGLKPSAHVGNLYGLKRQIARDLARSWGCAPEPESGFEGARRRRRR